MKSKILTMALLSALSFGFVSCDKDDDDNNEKKEEEKSEKSINFEAETNSFSGELAVVLGEENFETENVIVTTTPGEESTFDINMPSVKFSSQMPISINLTIPSIAYTKDGDNYTFEAESIIPLYNTKSGSVPYEKYTAKEIKGKIVGDSIYFSLKFADYPTSYKGVISK